MPHSTFPCRVNTSSRASQYRTARRAQASIRDLFVSMDANFFGYQ